MFFFSTVLIYAPINTNTDFYSPNEINRKSRSSIEKKLRRRKNNYFDEFFLTPTEERNIGMEGLSKNCLLYICDSTY